jgi:hypothetical protein
MSETRIIVLFAIDDEVLLVRKLKSLWIDVGTIIRKGDAKPNLVARSLFRQALGPVSFMIEDVADKVSLRVLRFRNKDPKWNAYVWHVRSTDEFNATCVQLMKSSLRFLHGYGTMTRWVPISTIESADAINLGSRWAILQLRAYYSSVTEGSLVRLRRRADDDSAGGGADSSDVVGGTDSTVVGGTTR